jgi:hypothetical protein
MTARRSWLVPFVAVAALGVAGGRLLAEDLDVPALLDGAKTAFQEKRYGKALSDLQLVVAEVGRMRGEALKVKLPEAPAGWTAAEAEIESGGALALMGGGTMVKRSYTKGDASVDLQVITDAGPLLAGVNMLLANPALVQGNYRIVTIKGRRALLEYDAGAKRGELSILPGNASGLVKVDGRGVSKADLTDLFGGALDLDGIEKTIRE